MREARPTRGQRRLVPPAMTAVLVGAASCGLVVLQLGAGGPRPELVQPGRDPIALAYLRVFAAGHPGDAAMHLRLAREELALGLLDDADRTLAALLAGDRASSEVVALALEVSLAAWRAAGAGTPERPRAQAHALARLESLLDRGPTLDLLTRVGAAARELGRPDLAARAAQRAATVDRDRCSSWFGRAARDALSAGDPAGAAASRRSAYDCERDRAAAHRLALDTLDAQVAADRGADALAFAGELTARFPDDPEILARGVAVALANDAPGPARQFAVRLRDTGAAEPAMLERLLDLDLAAGDLPAAWRTAERLVARAPDDPRLRRLAGQVADWAALPRPGLLHWMWLARRGDPAGREHALHLAHALDDDAALAALLTDDARRRPLGAAALGELAGALERLGSPDRAVALLERAARDATDDAAWEELVAFHERRRDLPAALAARTELARRLGPSLPRSLRLARLAWAAGRADAALAELGEWSRRAAPGETEYWQLLAELAWQQESNDLAERAYRAMWATDAIDPIGAERLVVLARDAGRPADAIRYGREGWERLGEPRLLLLAMDDAASAGRWDELGRLHREAMRDEARFADSLAYWLLCAQLEARRGRAAEAARDYRRALAVDAGSAAARAGLLWLLIDGDDRAPLAGALTRWAADAEDEPRLWRAYAVGLERIGRARDALAFYRREAEADPADPGARARYLAAVRRSAPAEVTAPAAPPRATVLTAELGATTLGPAVLRRLGAAARTDARGVALEVRSQLTQLTSDDPMLRTGHRAIDERSESGGRGPAGSAGGEGARPLSIDERSESGGRGPAGSAGGEGARPLSIDERSESGGRGPAGSAGGEGARPLSIDERSESGGRGPAGSAGGEGARPLSIDLLGGAALGALGGRAELFGGANLQRDGAVPRAAGAYTRTLSRAQLRVEAALNELAPESAVLLAEAMRTRAGGSVALGWPRLYARAGGEWRTWSTRTGTSLAHGAAGTLELGVHARLADPALDLRLSGGYQRNEVAMPDPAAPILPATLATLGIGASAARWRVGPTRLLLDAWLGEMAPPWRLAYRLHSGLAIEPFAGAELSLAGYVANDSWLIGHGELGLTVSLAYRISHSGP